MAPPTSQGTSSSTAILAGSSDTAIDAFSPLQFCEILRAAWVDRTEGTTVPITEEHREKQRKRRRKGKGRAESDEPYDSYGASPPSSSSSSDESDLTSYKSKSRAQNTATTRKRRILQQGKSLYLRVDLSASESCVKHIRQLQHDQSARNEVDKLVNLAQTASSASSSSTAPGPAVSNSQDGEDGSSSTTPTLASSPSKRRIRTVQEILQADIRAETLEQRIYLRLLISRTILRYVEKHTGCKYLYKGDKVEHYQSPYTSTSEDNGRDEHSLMSENQKARCTFWYECASSPYDERPCAGTMRVVADLDLGSLLATPKPVDGGESNGQDQLDNNEEEALRLTASTPARTPITRTYGSRSRRPNRYSSIPLSTQSARRQQGSTSRLSSAHPSATSESHDVHNYVPPFVFSIRLTHPIPHKVPYSSYRAKRRLTRAEHQRKLDKLKNKFKELTQEAEELRNIGGQSEDTFKQRVKELWEKAGKLMVPDKFHSDATDGEEDEQEQKQADAAEEQVEEAEQEEEEIEEADEEAHDQSGGEAEELSTSTVSNTAKEDGADLKTGEQAASEPGSDEQDRRSVSYVEEPEYTAQEDQSRKAVEQPQQHANHAIAVPQAAQVQDTEEEEDEIMSVHTEAEEERESSATPVKKRFKPDPDFVLNEADDVEEEYRPDGPKRRKWSRRPKGLTPASETSNKSASTRSQTRSRNQSTPSASAGGPPPSSSQQPIPPSLRRYQSERRTSQQPVQKRSVIAEENGKTDFSSSSDEETDYDEPVPVVASTLSFYGKSASKSSRSSTSQGSSKTPSRSSSKTLVNESSVKRPRGRPPDIMPPKAPTPSTSASAASKGKGKEGAGTTSTSTATSSSNTTTTGSSSTPSANASAAAQRRQPIGKVIHYFADNQSQGYDGLAFQEAYKTQVLAKVQEIQDAKKDEKSEDADVDVKDEDLQTFISLTGLKKEQAQEYFSKAKSAKLEDACRLYLHPSGSANGSDTTPGESTTNGTADVVAAAA
ncbi:hypothetical protein P389DRAFT_196807 [Cystobasidium minutum MCA 4210]|uniref:uncharacterized protein n=1 Tax=Cystobasidium minutum MCA 4210 TaxID=1397322 RepID=UPI0034D00E89|eukprot:jgi/Rhomi1/196807/gm1.5021_g